MSRHGSLAEQLSAFRRYVTEPDHEPEPIQTNWSVIPANDNNPEDLEDMKAERLWDISPSPEEIMRQVGKGDVEYGTHIDDDDKQHKVIVRMGRLRFSDGTQTEQGFKLSIDGQVVAAQIRMPVGAMLGMTDKERAQRGGDDNPEDLKCSNDYFAGKATEYRPAGLFKATPSKPVRKTKRQERTASTSKAEDRKMLADAMAKTTVPITKCPDGFPALPTKLAHLFPGLVKVATGDSGSQSWEDTVIERENRSEWFRWVDGLKPKDKAVLEAGKSARSFEELGGGEPKRTAIRRGKKALIAANDNLMAAIKACAA
jgi:hypothetical protein